MPRKPTRPRKLAHAAARFPPSLWTCGAVMLLLTAVGCGPGEDGEDQPAAGPRVENEALGLALAQLPAGFEVIRNEGDELVLGRSDGDDPARLTFELGPVQAAGVNLVDRVWEEKERIESMPEGDYRGQNELGGVPIGTTFTSRGRFVDEETGERVEEYRALALHPAENRVLVLDYEYPPPPPGEAEEHSRLQELMLVLEQIEPAGGGAPEAPGGGGEDAEADGADGGGAAGSPP
ncbi:MAG: hypothetical protein ACLF0P_15560 [Thermoanaerobaculia bacterium]